VGEMDIEFEVWRPGFYRRVERFQRVLGVIAAGSAMGNYSWSRQIEELRIALLAHRFEQIRQTRIDGLAAETFAELTDVRLIGAGSRFDVRQTALRQLYHRSM